MPLKKSLQGHSLHHQIETAKTELIENKQALVAQKALLTRKIHAQLTAPATLCIAGFTGFMLAEFNYRPIQAKPAEPDNKIRESLNKHQELTNKALNDERNAGTKNSDKPLSGQLPEKWSMENINQLLNSSTHILTLINSSLLCLKEITQQKVPSPETIKPE